MTILSVAQAAPKRDIAAEAWELYNHLVRRGCSETDAAAAADMHCQEECRKLRAERKAQGVSK